MEQQKLLWTILSVGILILILLGAGMFFFLPSDSTGLAQNGKTTEWAKAAAPVPEQKAPDTKATTAPAKPEVKKTPVQTPQAPAPAAKPEVKKTPVQPATPAPTPATKPAQTSQQTQQKPTTTTAPKATPAPATKPATTTTTTQQSTKPAQTQTAKPAQTQTAKPAATTTAAKGSYWVQVGSYATMDAAEKTKKDLAAKGYTSSIQSITANGKTYHRVKIGPYTSRADVDTLLPKIKALPGMGDSFITTK